MTSQFKNLTVSGSGFLQLPVGTTAQRTTNPQYTVVQFTSLGTTTWTVPAGISEVEVLVVGGGGGGGGGNGGAGGGGAGGLIQI